MQQNTTANLFSAMIAQNFLGTSDCVSRAERNPVVRPDASYDFGAWDPAADVYWDGSFVADLETGSNVSFGHLPLFSNMTRTRQWRSDAAPLLPIFGHRGPADGKASAHSLSCLADGSWSGGFLFNDGHIEPVHAAPGGAVLSRRLGDDPNPFNWNGVEDGRDVTIAFTKRAGRPRPAARRASARLSHAIRK